MDDVDVATIMRRIREQIRQGGRFGLPLPSATTTMADYSAPRPVAGADDLQHVLREVNAKWAVQERPFVSSFPLLGPFIVAVRTFWNWMSAKWFVRQIVQQQNEFNWAATRALDELACHLEANRRTAEEREGALAARLEESLHSLEERMGCLAEQQRDLEHFFRGLSRELAAKALGQLPPSTTSPLAHPTAAPIFDYYAFNRAFMATDATAKEIYRQYLTFFHGCQKVLDMGCGRGAFLELLAENGIGGYGVDSDEEMVRLCLGKGLEARYSEALEHLRSLEDASLDGLFAGHLIEHLPLATLLEFTTLCIRKLRLGAYLIAETPNTSNLYVLAHTYFRDPTHSLPLHPETYTFIFQSQGFSAVELHYSHPVPKDLAVQFLPTEGISDYALKAHLVQGNERIARLNAALFGPQNVAVIARR